MKNEKNKKIILLILITLLILGSLINGVLLTRQFYYKKEINKEVNNVEIDINDITDLDDANQITENNIIVETTIVDIDSTDTENDKTTDDKIDTYNKDNSNNKNNSSSNEQANKTQSSTINNYPNENTSNNDTNTDDNKETEDKEEIQLTQEEINDNYRNNIQNTYGIKIAYGEEMGSYLIGSYTPTKLTDASEINEYLTKIETEMKKYPNGFFKEMKDFGMPLTLYIVKDIPNSGISGLTDSQFADNIIISVKTSLLFETTLNHEIMHYIDVYINMKMYPDEISTLWNKLNPEGYEYGSFDTSLDFMTTQNNNSYFLTNYAQTNWREDRATLFGDMMTRVSKRSCYTADTPLYNKMKLISEQIDTYYTSVNSSTTEYWERFL